MTEIVKASLENGVQKIRITADKGYHPAHIQAAKRSSCLRSPFTV